MVPQKQEIKSRKRQRRVLGHRKDYQIYCCWRLHKEETTHVLSYLNRTDTQNINYYYRTCLVIHLGSIPEPSMDKKIIIGKIALNIQFQASGSSIVTPQIVFWSNRGGATNSEMGS